MVEKSRTEARKEAIEAVAAGSSSENPRQITPGDNENLLSHRARCTRYDKNLPAVTIVNQVPEIGQAAAQAETRTEIEPVLLSETARAVRENEQSKLGWDDTFSDMLPTRMLPEKTSVGPAQIQICQIDQLREKYPELKDADPYTNDGADRFVAKYLERERERLDNGEYATGKGDRPRDPKGDPSSNEYQTQAREAKRFEEMQAQWDDAQKRGDAETMRKILVKTYNSGLGSTQFEQVESKRLAHENPAPVSSPPVERIPSNIA